MSETEYRFYHCYQRTMSISCSPVATADVLPSELHSRLLFIPTYVPKILDRFILTYHYYKPVRIQNAR
jgi:hypothetical protein